MAPGSMRGSILTILSVAIGAGVLSIPYTFAQTGFALMCGFIVLGGFLALWSLTILISAA